MDAGLEPISARETALSDVVYERIGAAILDGRLAPGQRLRDADLAEELDVSRMPVREALQRLARIGLVEVVPSRYTRVTTPTPELMLQTLEYTGYQAGIAIHMALPRLSDDELAHALELLDASIAASDADDIDALYVTSRAFYRFLTEHTGNGPFGVMMREAGLALERNLRRNRPVFGTVEERARLYARLRTAVAARDRDAAELAVRDHHRLKAARIAR